MPSMNHSSRKRVRFGAVMIYHCGVEVGTSPRVSSGPPICLGPLLRQSITTVTALDMEVASRDWLAGSRKPVEKRHNMLLSSDVRVRMLLAAGFEQKEIENAAIKAFESRWSMIRAMQRRRAKKERSDSFRRLFSKLGFSTEEVKEADVERKEMIQATKPTVRAAKAC